MKVGIMSYWDTSHNYGQVIQCFALQQFLRGLGHEPFHIKYVPGNKPLKRKLTDFAHMVLSGHLLAWRSLKKQEKNDSTNLTASSLEEIQYHDSQTNPRDFDIFKDRYLSFSERAYTFDELKVSPPDADILIAGSDQIWCYPDPGYFLNFGSKKTLRIAYAPSFGGIKIENPLRIWQYRNLMKRLDVLTTRESGGVALAHMLGFKQTQQVPDPSFLLTPEQYRSIETSRHDKGYVFLYLLGNPIDIDVEEIFRWAQSRGLEVKYVGAQGRKDDFPKIYPNIDEWIELIDHAVYVITNSFHGMAMSIILNKNFTVIPVAKSFSRMNGRITDTLGHLDLTQRLFDGSFDILTDPIDYSRINGILEADRARIKTCFENWTGKPAK